MRLFKRRYEEGIKCPGCGWSSSRLFTLAESEKEADEIFDTYEEYGDKALDITGTAPLCGECIADVLEGGKHTILRSSAKEDRDEVS